MPKVGPKHWVVKVGGQRWTVMELLRAGIRPEFVLLYAVLQDVQERAGERRSA